MNMKILKFFSTIEKEKNYLEQMTKKGYILEKKKNGVFHFKKIEDHHIPVYEVYFRQFDSETEFYEYIYLCKERGWKLLHGNYRKGILCFIQEVEKECSDDVFNREYSKEKFLEQKLKENNAIIITDVILIILYGIIALLDGRFANKIALYAIPIFLVILIWGALKFLAIKHNCLS